MIKKDDILIKYVLLWLPLPFIAIINGTLRQTGYASLVSELTAHQISSVSGIVFFGIYTWFIEKRWPLTGTESIKIGVIWFFLTILFEFGFGHYIMHFSWSHLLHDYNILAGRVWSLVLVAILFIPFFIYKLQQR